MADDELIEAQSLAFAAVTQPVTSKLRNSRLTPTRKVTLQELHHMFGHADVATLRHMVDTTTGLRLKDVTAFSCETCLIGNSHKQYSRRKPTSPVTRFLQRVHVDIVGPITPTAEDGAKYWIIYTDDYTRYRWICNNAGKTRDPNLAWSHSEAYGSAWENRNLGSIDTYRSCTKGLLATLNTQRP
jgi:hypothetical protein